LPLLLVLLVLELMWSVRGVRRRSCDSCTPRRICLWSSFGLCTGQHSKRSVRRRKWRGMMEQTCPKWGVMGVAMSMKTCVMWRGR
jgi:hypothetical protein